MKRFLPFAYVVILVLVIVAIVSQTEQGALIRAEIQKRVQEHLPADLPKADIGSAEVPE